MPCLTIKLRDGTLTRALVGGIPTQRDIAMLQQFAQELADTAKEKEMLKGPRAPRKKDARR